MYKFLLIFILFSSVSPHNASAQKKVISQAKQYIKSGKDLDKAEKIITDLLNDSLQIKDRQKAQNILFDILKAKYEQGNELLYLKHPYDTISHYTTIIKMFNALEKLDSIDESSNLNTKYKEKHAHYLYPLRPNLYYGGLFFIRKEDYKRAYLFCEKYIESANTSLFVNAYKQESDSLMAKAAAWTVYCGYKLNDYERLMKYSSLAVKDTAQLAFVYQYMAEGYKQIGDYTKYADLLEIGFNKYPTFPFFFPRLIDYYNDIGNYEKSMSIVDKALEVDSTNINYMFAKSTILLNTGKYDECIDLCKKLIEENDSLAEAYYNFGVSYYNQAIALDKYQQRSKKNKDRIRELYSMSKPLLERFRELAPEQKNKWFPILYTIYLNLNMGEEFDEINRLK